MVLKSPYQSPITIEQWFEEVSISPKLQVKLNQLKISEVLLPEDKKLPFILKTINGKVYHAFLITDSTSSSLVKKDYIPWIEAHFKEILNDILPFLIIQDTKFLRFKVSLYELGLKENIIARASERYYKRGAMIEKLQEVADRIRSIDLPLAIQAIHVFGSILHEMELIHDIDIFLRCTKFPTQKVRMEKLKEALEVYGTQIGKILEKERKQKRSIKEIVEKSKELREILKKIAYPIDWFKCLTWKDLYSFHKTPPNHLIPEEDIIVKRLLIGNIKGFKDFFVSFKPYVAANYVLAWSPDKPNVKENIDGRPESEKIQFLKVELDTLIDEVKYFHERNYVVQESDMEEFEPLTLVDPKVERIDNETKDELKEKIEIIRNQLRELVIKWSAGWEIRDD